VTGALIGFAGICAAAILGLLGVLRTSRPPAHLADVEGLARLLDEVQEERDNLRAQLRECQEEAKRLRGEDRRA
jgi:hypothetical protein